MKKVIEEKKALYTNLILYKLKLTIYSCLCSEVFMKFEEKHLSVII